MARWHLLVGWPVLMGSSAPSSPPASLPAYDEEVLAAAWQDLDRRIAAACRWPGGDPSGGAKPTDCKVDKLDGVVERSTHYLRHLGQEGRILYHRAMAHRLSDRARPAIRDLQRAAAIDPTRPEIHGDLGELLASEGDLDGAREAFGAVTRLVPDGPNAWYGWFQLAQLDARQRRADDLSHHLRQAIRFGFQFRWLAGNPLWAEAYSQPALREVLDRLGRVYGDDEALKTLLPENAP